MNTVGIVTEGRGEIFALPTIYSQLQEYEHVVLLKPIHVSVDPRTPIPLLCKRLVPKINQSHARGANYVVVLLDSEDGYSCPGERAQQILRHLNRLCSRQLAVVLKHTKLENWLISDRSAFRAQRRLFPEYRKIEFARGRADEVDAERLITAAMGKSSDYSKI